MNLTDTISEPGPTEVVSVENLLPLPPSPKDKDLDALTSEGGLIKVPTKVTEDIEKLGVKVAECGAVKFADGFSVFTASHAAMTMVRLTDLLEKGGNTSEEIQSIARTVAVLAKAMTGLSSVLKQRQPIQGLNAQPRLSFPANARVTFVNNQTILQDGNRTNT